MQTIEISQKNSKEIVKIIKNSIQEGKVIACPTDTVYGLVCDATNKKAVEKLFKTKKRPKTKPVPIFVNDLKQAKTLAKINKRQESFLKSVWPGKVTAVLKRKKRIRLYGVDEETIALRIPKHRLINKLFKKIDIPLIGTSANISNGPAETKIKKVLEQFKNKKNRPDLIIDAGNLPKSNPSTVIDLTVSPPKILRI